MLVLLLMHRFVVVSEVTKMREMFQIASSGIFELMCFILFLTLFLFLILNAASPFYLEQWFQLTH